MTPVGLDQIRRKVEAGDRLSDEELRHLERAAHDDPGPTLKLAHAHALLNAEANRQGLERMRALRQSYPRDIQVLLGFGRALVSLELWTEAEQALREALLVNPGDLEAEKVLAIVYMRRGEFVRARKLVAELVRRDPFDGEARLIKEELEAAEAMPPPEPEPAQAPDKADKDTFVKALLAALTARGVRHLRRAGELWIKSDEGGVGRLELGSLHAAYLEDGRALPDVVGSIATELASAANLPESAKGLLGRVYPVLRPQGFEEIAKGAVHREGPAGVRIFYVLDDPELVRYVPEAALDRFSLPLDALDAASWANLEARGAQARPVIVSRGEPRLSPEALGLWAVCEGDGYDAARLLCPSEQRRLAELMGEGPYRVSFGRRELTLVCREADPAAVAQLEALLPGADGIPGRFTLVDGRLSRDAE
jgi:tetratricopeptide (TPR) repeat protein